VEAFRKYAKEALDELAASDAFSKKVLESYNKFKQSISGWTDIADKNYD
jgi:TRAP-type mannitol/chloroaromatic compound transport system substrate-binding protein